MSGPLLPWSDVLLCAAMRLMPRWPARRKGWERSRASGADTVPTLSDWGSLHEPIGAGQ